MATKVRNRTSVKQSVRFKRKRRIRAKVRGTAERPRLVVFRSNQNIYAQVIDDVKEVTLASASTLDDEFNAAAKKSSIDGAKGVGLLIAKRALAKNLKSVVFDRSGYVYHGRIRALADAAREGGLSF